MSRYGVPRQPTLEEVSDNNISQEYRGPGKGLVTTTRDPDGGVKETVTYPFAELTAKKLEILKDMASLTKGAKQTGAFGEQFAPQSDAQKEAAEIIMTELK